MPIMRITNVTVNLPDGEREYNMNRPDWEMHSMLAEVERHHPSATSLVIVMVRDEPIADGIEEAIAENTK